MRNVLRDESGAGLVEFSALLPLLLLLFAGMVDVSRLIAAAIDVEQAAQRGTDYSLALRPNSGDGSHIRTDVANAAGVPEANVTVDIFLECDGVRQVNFSSTCPGSQEQARFVGVLVAKEVDFIFDWPSLTEGADAEAFTVQGDSLIRFQ